MSVVQYDAIQMCFAFLSGIAAGIGIGTIFLLK